jgi:hypothetical protein
MVSLNKLNIIKLKGAINYIIWSIRTEATLTKEGLLNTLKSKEILNKDKD